MNRNYNPAYYPTTDQNVLRGSLLMTFDAYNGNFDDHFLVTVNGTKRDNEYHKSDRLYSTYLYVGDVVNISIVSPAGNNYAFTGTRTDYTIIEVDNNNGIYTNTPTIGIGGNQIFFTVATIPTAYNFDYNISSQTDGGTFRIMAQNHNLIQTQNNEYINYQH